MKTIFEKIRWLREEAYRKSGVIPRRLYLGSQAHKDLLEAAEKYLRPRKDRILPQLPPDITKFRPPPDQFMAMVIEEKKDWEPDRMEVGI